VAALGQGALWLWRGGAKRAALELLDRYGAQRGSDREVLQAWVLARGWWKGTGGGFDLLTRRRLVGAGVSLCPVAADPDDEGCRETLDAVEADPALLTLVTERAEQRQWRIDLPRPAVPRPEWSDAALRRWRAVLAVDARLDAAAGRLLTRWGRSVGDARTAARGRTAATPPAPARGTVPLGLAVVGTEPELGEIAVAFAREPELADRLAAEYVHRMAAAGVRAP
jgi:hypothetical protein